MPPGRGPYVYDATGYWEQKLGFLAYRRDFSTVTAEDAIVTDTGGVTTVSFYNRAGADASQQLDMVVGETRPHLRGYRN